MRGEPLLSIENLSVIFGGLAAVDGLSMTVERGETVALIGPNGAGKSTVVNAITGFQRPTAGRVRFGGQAITGRPAHQICQLGIARTFQLVRTFGSLTALQNVTGGALAVQPNLRRAVETAREKMSLLGLSHLQDERAADLPIVHQKQVELARALATGARLLILDEVITGLNPTETQKMIQTLREIRERFQLSVLFIEHVMQAVAQLADRVVVINYGKKIAEGRLEEVSRDAGVIEAYLGRRGLRAASH